MIGYLFRERRAGQECVCICCLIVVFSYWIPFGCYFTLFGYALYILDTLLDSYTFTPPATLVNGVGMPFSAVLQAGGSLTHVAADEVELAKHASVPLKSRQVFT